MVKIWSRKINWRPRQPVRVGGAVGTFVEIHPPDSLWSRRDHLAVSSQQGDGDTVRNGPRDRFLDFRINNAGQRMQDCYLAAFTIRNYNPLFPWLPLKMKKHGAAAIHLKVKVSFGHIGTWCKEEFDTTVFVNIILMCCGNCTNVSVLDSKHYIYCHVVVSNLHLYLWEMIRLLSHVVPDHLGWNVFPRKFIPSKASHRKGLLFYSSTKHKLVP